MSDMCFEKGGIDMPGPVLDPIKVLDYLTQTINKLVGCSDKTSAKSNKNK